MECEKRLFSLKRLILSLSLAVGLTTLAISPARGATDEPRLDFSRPQSQPMPPDPKDDGKTNPAVLTTTDILTPPPLKQTEPAGLPTPSAFTRTLSGNAAGIVDFDKDDSQFSPDVVWGITYAQLWLHRWHWRVRLEVPPQSLGMAGFSLSRAFFQRGPYHFFFSVGAKTRFVAREELATLVNIYNLQAPLALGADVALSSRYFASLELEYAPGFRFHTAQVMLGAGAWF